MSVAACADITLPVPSQNAGRNGLYKTGGRFGFVEAVRCLGGQVFVTRRIKRNHCEGSAWLDTRGAPS